MDIYRFSTLLVISSVPFARCDCPGGFPYQFSCSCYRIVSSFVLERDRSEAMEECVSQSSHLVFIESQEEADYLAGEYDDSNFYWIGLNGREFQDKTWDDGSPADFLRFVDETEPFGDDSGCYKVVPPGYGVPADTWHDHVCWGNIGYICETQDTSCGIISTSSIQEVTTLESTKQPTTPEPTTVHLSTSEPSTLKLSTYQQTTLKPSTTVVITTEKVLTTQESVIDVGSFFGVPASGIYIPADSVLRSRGTVTSVSRCGLLCPPLVCRAFMYSEDENICNLAISYSTSSEGQIYSKLMRCSRVGGKLICT